jgi:hypothetical protein
MRGQIDFAALAAALDPARLVPAWLPDGRRNGREWVARNPTRADHSPGSFSINLTTGAWADFATGDEGGDLISLFAYLFHGKDQGAAARELIESQGLQHVAQTAPAPADPKVKNLDQPRPVLPVPADAPAPDFRHPSHGEPSTVWPYYDADGRVLLYVARFDHADGRKDICPLTWCEHPGKAARWTWRGITGTAPRPLYGLDRLAALTDADVLVVEGEKSADAAQRILGRQLAVVAWLGGTSSADRVALAPLRGRRVFLWPDFDRQTYPEKHAQAGELKPLHEQPGAKAMLSIAKALGGVAESVHMVGYDPASDRFASGWDLADAEAVGWKAQNVLQFLELHGGNPFDVAGQAPAAPLDEPPPADAPPSEAPPHDDEPATAANDNRRAVPLDQPLNPYGWPHLTEKGQPQNTIENTAHLLREYGIAVAYNQIGKEVEIGIPGRSFSIDNRAGNCMAVIGSLCARNRLPKTDLGDHLAVIADTNPRNPAAEWILSVPWDGRDRLGELVRTLDPVDYDLALILLRRWMIGAVACALNADGMSMQGALVLTGAQGVGKTTWFATLAGGDKELFKEGAQLNPDDKDSVKGALSHWIVELGELDATFRKADIAALKAFITKDRDEIRLPYARASSRFPRRTALCATVNEKKYLRDDTGNRRYWSIDCGPGLIGMHDVDVAQVWAQIVADYRRGEQHRLTPEEMARLNDANESFAEVNPIEEMLRSKFDWSEWIRPIRMTATEALIAIGYDKPNRQQTRDAGVILRKLTGGEPRKSNGREVYELPRRVSADGTY